MLTESQIIKWVNFVEVIEFLLPDFSLRGYDGETILDSEGLCPACGTQLNEWQRNGDYHELYFYFFTNEYECKKGYKSLNRGSMVDFVMIVKKYTKDEAILFINDLISGKYED
jgi:hypothetical protein